MELVDSWWLSLLVILAIVSLLFFAFQKLGLPWPAHAMIGIMSFVANICLNHSTLLLGQHIEWRKALFAALIGLAVGELGSAFRARKLRQGQA